VPSDVEPLSVHSSLIVFWNSLASLQLDSNFIDVELWLMAHISQGGWTQRSKDENIDEEERDTERSW
jgi:hypothetical protein